jgi:hypothetical protein
MKKELMAALLLAGLFVCSLVNIGALDALSEQMTLSINQVERDASSERWDEAAASARNTVRLWESRSGYTHIVLRHSVIEDMSDKLSELTKAVYARSPGDVAGAAEAARARMNSIVTIEHIRPGSVF